MLRSRSVGGISLAALVVYLLVFYYLLTQHGIAHPHPVHHLNFLWGGLQGLFVLPSYVLSIFEPHHYVIYQVPNDGVWYNGGYLLGIALLFGGPVSAI